MKGKKMTYQTVTFKGKKYNIDDDKTSKNLNQIQEKEIKRLTLLLNQLNIYIEKQESKMNYLKKLDQKSFLQVIKLQNKITDYETNYIKLSENEEVVSLVIKNNKNKGIK